MNSHIKGVFKLLGLDIRLIRNIRTSQEKDLELKWTEQWHFLQKYDVRTIIDVGANTGQFASMIHRVCPWARIISFEPVMQCFSQLKKNLSIIPNAQAFNVALGAEATKTAINRSEFTPSSSFLEMTDLHKRDWPQSVGHSRELIEMRRLDDMIEADSLAPDVLVKIDVQGYESKVIEGGKKVLSHATLVVLEASFVELYKGQPLFGDIYDLMIDLGFRYVGNVEQYASHIDGQILFGDAIFENTKKFD